MGWFQRADYRWILLADPPVCRSGRPEVVLNNCDRLRRGEVCRCRFETQEIVEDLGLIDAGGALDDWLTVGELDERDVEDLRDALRKVVERSRSGRESASADAADAIDRLDQVTLCLSRLVDHGSGLSDRYADDLD